MVASLTLLLAWAIVRMRRGRGIWECVTAFPDRAFCRNLSRIYSVNFILWKRSDHDAPILIGNAADAILGSVEVVGIEAKLPSVNVKVLDIAWGNVQEEAM